MTLLKTVEEIKLSNNAKCLFLNAPNTPVIAYAIQFRSGLDSKLAAYPYQTAHTLEHMVEAGPDNSEFKHKATYLQEIQKNGAWRNAFTGQFGISYVGDCIPEELIRILKLRISAIENPKLTEDNLKSEKGNVLEELKQRTADYSRLATALSRKELSNNNWLTSKEAIDEAATVDLNSVIDYYQKTHTTNNLRLVIAGDVSKYKELILNIVSKVKLPAGERLNGPALLPANGIGYKYEQNTSLEILYTNYSMAIVRQLGFKDIAVMKVVNYLLCNSWDSKILGKARQAGICYGMQGYTECLKNQTIWSFDTPVSPKNAAEFFSLMRQGLEELALGKVLAEELENAKNYLIGKSRKNGQTSLELLNIYADNFFGLDTISETMEEAKLLSEINIEDICKLVNEFLSSKSKIFSGVGSIGEESFKNIYQTKLQNPSN